MTTFSDLRAQLGDREPSEIVGEEREQIINATKQLLRDRFPLEHHQQLLALLESKNTDKEHTSTYFYDGVFIGAHMAIMLLQNLKSVNFLGLDMMKADDIGDVQAALLLTKVLLEDNNLVAQSLIEDTGNR